MILLFRQNQTDAVKYADVNFSGALAREARLRSIMGK